MNIPLQKVSSCPTSSRYSVQARIRVNGSQVRSGTASQGYIRCSNNHEFSSIHWFGFLHNLGVGDVITVGVIGEAGTGSPVQVAASRKASLFIEKLDNTSKSISLFGNNTTTGNNWNATSNTSVRWSGETLKDSSTFNHSTTTNNHQITLNESGDYLILYSDVLTGTVSRSNVGVQIRKNGTLPRGAECFTHYIRNSNGHREATCTIQYLLENVSAGDIVDIGLSASAATGTVNDLRDAEIHIFQISAQEPILDIASIPNKTIHFDMSNPLNILDSANRNGNDLSFSGTVATLKDSSGIESPHDGLQANSAQMPTYDKNTNVLNFDGNDDIFEIINASDINTGVTSERTFAMVFRTGADVVSRQMIYEEGGTVRGINVYIRNSSLYLGFWNDTNDGDGRQTFVSTNTTVSANTNYYVTLVYDYSNYTGPNGPDGILRGMVNNTPFSFSGSTTSRLYSHPGAIGLGGMNNGTCYDNGCIGGNGDYFGGDIFEFIMYNAAISPALESEYYNFLSNKWPDPFPVTNLTIDSQYTNDGTVSPNISWSASISTDIDHYEAAIGTSVGSEDVLTYQNVGNVLSTQLTGLSLLECINYYVSVKAVDPEPKESTIETTNFFKYDGTAPSDPGTIVLSGTASTSTSLSFSWTASTDSCAFESYEVALGTTASGNDVVDWIDVGTNLVYQFTDLALLNATDYYVSVRAKDAAGNYSTITSSASWQVSSCVDSDSTNPTDPSDLSLSGFASSTSSPTLNWTASIDSCGLSHYELAVGTSLGASDLIAFTNVGNVTDYKFFSISPGLATNTDYYTSIRAVDLAGNTSAIVSSLAWSLPAPGNVSSGLVLWLDAADTSTLFENNDCSTGPVTTDAQFVGCWKDKSQVLNNAIAVGASRPTYQTNEFNAQSVLRFDGIDDALDFSNINNIRTVFVVNKSSQTSYQPLLGDATSNDWFTNDTALLGSSSSTFLQSGNWRVNKSSISDPLIITQSGEYSLYNVVSTGNVEADHISSDRKSSGRFFGGDYVEVLVYDRALSETEVTQVENYLYDKWFSAAPGPLGNLILSSAFTNINNVTPDLSWDHSIASDFSFYEVALGQINGSNDVAGWFNIGTNNNYSFNGTALAECSNYYISVRAVDIDNFRGEVRSSSSFKYDDTSPDTPASLVLSGTASTSTSPTVTWGASNDTCSNVVYEVSLGTSVGSTDVVAWIDIGSLTTYQFTGLGLSNGTNYFINIRAKDEAGNLSGVGTAGPFQTTPCVTTDTTNPSPPTGISLIGTPTLSSSPQASFTAGSDTCAFSHHDISIGTSTTSDDVIGWTNIGQTTIYTFENISPELNRGVNYYINVRSVDLAGNTSAILSSNTFSLLGPGAVDASGLAVWVDASEDSRVFSDSTCTNIQTSNNGMVGCLKDISGNGNDLTVSNSANKPVFKTNGFNGESSIYFDGATNEFLNFDTRLTDIRTVFWVIKEDSSNPGNNAFLLGDSSGSTNDFNRGGTAGPIFDGNASVDVLNGSLQQNKVTINGQATNMPIVETVLSIVTNGNVTADSFSRDRISCCGGRTFGGQLAELIIFNRALTSGEVNTVEDYLLVKWNIVSTATEWTGSLSNDWFNGGNWSNGVPTSNLDCLIADKLNDPVINSPGAICRDLTITTGNLMFQNASNADLAVFDDIDIQTGTLTINDGVIVISDNGTNAVEQNLNFGGQPVNLSFSKSAGATAIVETDTTFNSFLMPSGSNFEFRINTSRTSSFPNGLNINGGVFMPENGARVEIGDGQTLVLNGGTLKTAGINDPLGVSGQNMADKVTFTSIGSTPWAFTATSGIVDLVGFHFQYLDSNGLYIGGNTNLLNLDGGQFSYLEKDYLNPSKGLHLDTTATISESIAVNIGFNWGAPNTGYAGDPLPSDNYYTVYANNCGGGSLVFDQWFGDFWGAPTPFDTETKIYDNEDGGNCNVAMDIAVSPVTLTEFKATPYSGEVLIEWTTGSELDHLGFNLYRSSNPIDGFVQINNELIRNYLSSGEFRGRYRFVDPGLTNGEAYFYLLEDVATNGEKENHGPIFAKPEVSYGAIPAPDSDVNTPVNDPGSINLGNGVALLTQTQGSFRISINPAAATMTTASWDSNFLKVSIPGYVKLSVEGAPELLQRRILVPVNRTYSNIQHTVFSQTRSDISGILSGKKISPAPSFSPNSNGELVPSYVPDSNYYSLTSDYPSNESFTVSPSTVNILGKNYVEIFINPLMYEPDNDNLERLDQLVLDIGLDAPAWDYLPPTDIYRVAPSVAEGTLTIKYNQEGIYRITYDEISSENLEGPFANEDLNNIRLFYHGIEVPIEITSSDGFFNSGDSILFYGALEESKDDEYDNVVLASYNFYGDDFSNEEPLRLTSLLPSNTNYTALDETHKMVTLFNQNNYEVLEVPVGVGEDHLFLRRIFTQSGQALSVNSSHTETISITQIDPLAEFIQIKVKVLSRKVIADNPRHNLRLSVNGTPVQDQNFVSDVPINVIFNVPVNYFVSGNNTITLTALGDLVQLGDFDMMNIQNIEINYDRINYKLGNQSIFVGGLADQKFTARGFSDSSLRVFDIGSPRNFFEYGQTFIDTFDNGTTYQISFKNISGDFAEGGNKKIVVESTNYLTPSSIKINTGVETLLTDSTNDFTYIVISNDSGMNAAKRLVAHRTNGGLNSIAVSLEQVYGEFSNGRKDEFAINSFLQFAKNNWAVAPQYVLIIGDATYDPKDDLEYAGVTTDPVLLYRGQENDYGSDLAYGLLDIGTDEESKDSFVAIGRLPSDNTFLIESYVDKLIDYENGDKAPSDNVKKAIFIAGAPDDNENFFSRITNLSNTVTSANSEFSVDLIDRSSLGTDEATTSAVTAAFNDAPLFLTYMGHGAENLWGLNGFYEASDGADLINERLPIVLGLGCLNSYYYDADLTWKSLAEEMVLNPNGGAIAFWGSTTFTSPSAQNKLATLAFSEFGQRSKTAQTETRIGEFMLSAQAGMEKNKHERDMVMSWTLFGDPALKLPPNAFSEPVPAPEAYQPAEAESSSESKGVFGCSVIASEERSQSNPWNSLAFIIEFLSYILLYRNSLTMLKLIKKKS